MLALILRAASTNFLAIYFLLFRSAASFFRFATSFTRITALFSTQFLSFFLYCCNHFFYSFFVLSALVILRRIVVMVAVEKRQALQQILLIGIVPLLVYPFAWKRVKKSISFSVFITATFFFFNFFIYLYTYLLTGYTAFFYVCIINQLLKLYWKRKNL